jgi:hypothetical protein
MSASDPHELTRWKKARAGGEYRGIVLPMASRLRIGSGKWAKPRRPLANPQAHRSAFLGLPYEIRRVGYSMVVTWLFGRPGGRRDPPSDNHEFGGLAHHPMGEVSRGHLMEFWVGVVCVEGVQISQEASLPTNHAVEQSVGLAPSPGTPCGGYLADV